MLPVNIIIPTYRLAEHLSTTHNLHGYTWRNLRMEILRIASEAELDSDEQDLLVMVPQKVPYFDGTSIDISYLNIEKDDQTNEEFKNQKH